MRRTTLPSVAWPCVQYFPHHLINGTTFGKTLLNIIRVFWFSQQISPEIFLILRRLLRDNHKCTNVFMYSARYSCQMLMTLEFSWQTFQKSSGTKFNENLSRGSRVVPCELRARQTDGRTEGHDEVYSRFSRFWKRVQNFRTMKEFQVSELSHCAEN